MKRHLLIATIICAATTLPASAIIKNIAINEYLSCAHVSPYGHADWVAECFQQTTDTPSLRVFGIAACSNQSGTGYSDTSDKITASYNIDDNIHCWCKMTVPAVSSWVYTSGLGDYGTCVENCNTSCGVAIRQNSNFRKNMFKSLSD